MLLRFHQSHPISMTPPLDPQQHSPQHILTRGQLIPDISDSDRWTIPLYDRHTVNIFSKKKNYNYITQYPNLVFPLSVLQNNRYSRPHDYVHINTDLHFSIGGIEYMHSMSLTLSSWLCVHNVAITRSKKKIRNRTSQLPQILQCVLSW